MSSRGEYDLISVGGGLGGFVAALRVQALGLRPLILEKTDLLGGVAAYSGGSVWIPNNHLAAAAGYEDSHDEAAAYLDFLGDSKAIHDASLRRAFLNAGPAAVRFLCEEIGIPFEVTGSCDSAYPDGAGSKPGGRTLEVSFDGVALGPYQRLLRRSPYYPSPGILLREIEEAGGSINAAVAATASQLHTRRKNDFLARGGGLMASLIHAALVERGIECKTNARVVELIIEDRTVAGVVVRKGDDGDTIRARGMVMLATGSYGYAPYAAELEGLPGFSEQAPPGVEGDGLVLGSQATAAVVRAGNGFCTVGFLSRRMHPGTSIPMHLPLIGSAAFPHSIIVNRAGVRFGDESAHGMFMVSFRETGNYGAIQFRNWPAFFICDDRFRAYPIMGAGDEWPAEDLKSAMTIAGLAQELGIDEAGLDKTIKRFNLFAELGQDQDFGRGRSSALRSRRNDEDLPNQMLGALQVPPFWGARLQILGAGMGSHGLRIDSSGRVLDWREEPIQGLFATGNALAYTDVPFGYQDGLANARNITYAYLGANTVAERARTA